MLPAQMTPVLVILALVSQDASAVDMFIGEHFLLSCEFPTFELDDPPTVVWSRSDLKPPTVHQRQQDGDDLKDQNELYRGRTSMMADALQTGELSLNLTGLQQADSGTYSCSIRSARGERKITDVQLQVKEHFPLWATVLLVLLTAVLLIAGGGLVYFRQYFMSVYQTKVEPGKTSVLLPCKTIARLPTGARVEWIYELNNMVHAYQNDSDQLVGQYELCRGRTEMTRNPLRTGNLSLTLKYPADEDSGTYTCTVYSTERRTLMTKRVKLKVKVCHRLVDQGEECVELPFQTTDKLPDDSVVEWTRYVPARISIHSYSSHPAVQNQSHIGRTQMKGDALRTGDLSLILHNPTEDDTGRYVCGVWTPAEPRRLLRNKTVQLQVKGSHQGIWEGSMTLQ